MVICIVNQNIKPEKKSNSNLSIISLIFLICEIVSGIFGILEFVPWIYVSLTLAIISKCKYNDKMSLVVLIIDIILITLSIILAIILLILVIFGITMIGIKNIPVTL